MDDLISRKALLADLRALDPPGFEDSIAGKVAIKKIKEALAVSLNPQWISGKKPPKEWKDEKGDAMNFLAVIPGIGVDIANWIEPTRCWFCMGVPCKVTHWMPLPTPPKEE